MSSLFFAGQGAEEADKILDLRVREIEAEGGHPRLSDRRASPLDDVEEVLVRERLRATRVGEVSWAHQEERRTPGAVATRPVAGDAVGEVEPLGWRGVGRGGRWGPEGDEDHEVEDDHAEGRQQEKPARWQRWHRPIIACPPHPALLGCPSPLLLSPEGRGRVRGKGFNVSSPPAGERITVRGPSGGGCRGGGPDVPHRGPGGAGSATPPRTGTRE